MGVVAFVAAEASYKGTLWHWCTKNNKRYSHTALTLALQNERNQLILFQIILPTQQIQSGSAPIHGACFQVVKQASLERFLFLSD